MNRYTSAGNSSKGPSNAGKGKKHHCPSPPPPPPVPCFVKGSVVITKNGSKRVEDLNVGDFVLTKDNGLRKIIWIGSANGNSPVKYKNSLFSPQHRITQFINNEEILVPAIHLAKINRAQQIVKNVTYVHFMFEQHQIVNVDGIWSESFYPGEWIINNSSQGKEIVDLFGHDMINSMQLSRNTKTFKELKELIAA